MSKNVLRWLLATEANLLSARFLLKDALEDGITMKNKAPIRDRIM